MPDNATPRFRSVVPMFLVEDVIRTAEYYRDVLGFQFSRYYGEPPAFVIVRRDEALVFLKRPDEELAAFPRNAPCWDAYFYVEDIDALHAELQERGARIVCGPQDQVYGMREVEVRDCDDRLLCFGQPID